MVASLAPVLSEVDGILIYGSIARGEESEMSDVDVCLVASETDCISLSRKSLMLPRDDRCDIRVFELMPSI